MERCARRGLAREPGALAVVCLVTVSLVMSTGCSWIFVDKPPGLPIEPTPPVACTSSVAAPVADTVGAVLLGLIGIAGFANATCSGGFLCSSETKTTSIIGGLAGVALATTLVVSASSGYSNTARCQELKQAQALCLTGAAAACHSLKPETTPGALTPGPAPQPNP